MVPIIFLFFCSFAGGIKEKYHLEPIDKHICIKVSKGKKENYIEHRIKTQFPNPLWRI